MKTIFLDLDNTLTDRTATIYAYAPVFLHDFAEHLAVQPGTEQFGELINQLDCGGYSTHEQRSEQITALDIWQDPPSVANLVEHWQAWVPHHSLPMPGLNNCLQTLQQSGYRLCLVTNGKGPIQRAKVACLGIAQFFAAMIISGEVNVKKPDPRIFQLALTAMACAPSDGVFIGDHPINDYQGSLRAGLIPVWFQGSHRWPAAQPAAQYSIDQLAQLPALLASLN